MNAANKQRGVALVVFALTLVSMSGFRALAVDIGYLQYVQQRLQASSDAAALAGGRDINCCAASKAISTAISYSSTAGGHNEIPGVTVTMPSGPELKCLTSMQSTLKCTGYDKANAIVVRQRATVPLFFAPVIGVRTATINANSMASAAGGAIPPLNVIVVLDTTASMNNSNPACGKTRLGCALTGVQSLLLQLTNPLNRVGLMTFPPLANASQAALQYDCKASANPTIASSYSQAGLTYQIVGLGNDYLTAGKALNNASNLVKAVGGATGCASLTAVGGVGTYYAGAISAAQAALPSNGNQNVIILVSDGDASSNKMGTLNTKQQCQQAVTAAAAATTAGTWVYSLAYGAAKSGCSTDTAPTTNACAAMQSIASKPSMFFSDSTSSCSATGENVIDLFTQVGNSLMVPRRLPINAL